MHQNDIIYGCTIGEYCEKLGVSIQQLINFTKIDISIMRSNLNDLDIMHPNFDIIHKAMSKKQKHLLRLEEWYSDNLSDQY